MAERVELFTHAVSLGGVDSLIQHPAALTHRPVAPAARPGADILRLSQTCRRTSGRRWAEEVCQLVA